MQTNRSHSPVPGSRLHFLGESAVRSSGNWAPWTPAGLGCRQTTPFWRAASVVLPWVRGAPHSRPTPKLLLCPVPAWTQPGGVA